MKEEFIQNVLVSIQGMLSVEQIDLLVTSLTVELSKCELVKRSTDEEKRAQKNAQLLSNFLSAKKIEGCSDKTLHYYQTSIEKLLAYVQKHIIEITTNDIRCYLSGKQSENTLSKVTIDNLRRIFSSFFLG